MVRVEERQRKGKGKAEWSKCRDLLSKKNVSRVFRSPDLANGTSSNMTMTLSPQPRQCRSVLGTMSMSGPARNLTCWASNLRSLVAFGSCYRTVVNVKLFFFLVLFFFFFLIHLQFYLYLHGPSEKVFLGEYCYNRLTFLML